MEEAQQNAQEATRQGDMTALGIHLRRELEPSLAQFHVGNLQGYARHQGDWAIPPPGQEQHAGRVCRKIDSRGRIKKGQECFIRQTNRVLWRRAAYIAKTFKQSGFSARLKGLDSPWPCGSKGSNKQQATSTMEYEVHCIHRSKIGTNDHKYG